MLLTRIVLCLSLLISNATLAKEVLRVGYLPLMDHLILPVAHVLDNQHYQHVDVKPRLFKKWSELGGALKANKIDAAFILSPFAMEMFQNGLDIKTILLAHRNGSSITVSKTSNIKEAIDLKGKKIAIPWYTATHATLLNNYLKTANLSLKDISLRIIAPPNMPKAMELGFLDGFMTPEPFGTKAVQQGIGNILVLSREVLHDHVDCIVAIHNAFLKQHPEAVKEWLSSLVKASEWIEHDRLTTNSQTIADLMTTNKYLPHSKELIIDSLSLSSHKISFMNLKPEIEDLEVIFNFSKEAGIINNNVVDLTDFIDTRFYPTILQ